MGLQLPAEFLLDYGECIKQKNKSSKYMKKHSLFYTSLKIMAEYEIIMCILRKHKKSGRINIFAEVNG